ncbi:hypothetical protein [Mucilaginibacter sp.]
MNSLKAVLFTIGLIIINSLLGYYLPPISIIFTPVVVGLTTYVLARTNIKIYFIIIFIIITLALNDILVKITAGGTSDFEGAGLINLLFFVTVIISTIIAISILIDKKKERTLIVVLFCLLIPVASCCYISYFDFLGLTDYLNTSKTKEISQKSNLFISDLKFSDNQINYNNDSLKIIDGWCEKGTIVDHTHLMKHYDDTSSVNYVIRLKANKNFNELNISYNINDTSMNGSNNVNTLIKFSLSKSTSPIILTFFKMRETWAKSFTIKQISIYKR